MALTGNKEAVPSPIIKLNHSANTIQSLQPQPDDDVKIYLRHLGNNSGAYSTIDPQSSQQEGGCTLQRVLEKKMQ